MLLAAAWDGPPLTELHENIGNLESSIDSAGLSQAERVGGSRDILWWLPWWSFKSYTVNGGGPSRVRTFCLIVFVYIQHRAARLPSKRSGVLWGHYVHPISRGLNDLELLNLRKALPFIKVTPAISDRRS